MNIEKELKKEQIEIIEELNILRVNQIAKNTANIICKTFKHYNLNESALFVKLSNLHMYRANMPEGMSEAVYYYKNSSIYFNSNIDPYALEEFAIHECIHNIQEIRNDKNSLIKMGLSTYKKSKVTGIGINEAAVQLMTSKILGTPIEYVKYYGLKFESLSPSYYPLECQLINLLSFLVGEDILFNSTLFSTDDFKNTVVSLMSQKVFHVIETSFDELLCDEEKLLTIESSSKKNKEILKTNIKDRIKINFLRTQNLIIYSYFTTQFSNINNLETLELYRRKLNSIRKYLADSDFYTYYNNFHAETMNKLEHLHGILENNGNETALAVPAKKSLFTTLLNKIYKLIGNKTIENA